MVPTPRAISQRVVVGVSNPGTVAEEEYTGPVHGLLRIIFSEPKYYLYGVLIVIVAGFLLLLFMMQTGTTSGGSPR